MLSVFIIASASGNPLVPYAIAIISAFVGMHVWALRESLYTRRMQKTDETASTQFPASM